MRIKVLGFFPEGMPDEITIEVQPERNPGDCWHLNNWDRYEHDFIERTETGYRCRYCGAPKQETIVDFARKFNASRIFI